MVFGIVVQDLVVDFVGENNQVVLTGDLDDLLQQFFGINGARRVIRVNDDDSTGAWRNFGADIVEVREPV